MDMGRRGIGLQSSDTSDYGPVNSQDDWSTPDFIWQADGRDTTTGEYWYMDNDGDGPGCYISGPTTVIDQDVIHLVPTTE